MILTARDLWLYAILLWVAAACVLMGILELTVPIDLSGIAKPDDGYAYRIEAIHGPVIEPSDKICTTVIPSDGPRAQAVYVPCVIATGKGK